LEYDHFDFSVRHQKKTFFQICLSVVSGFSAALVKNAPNQKEAKQFIDYMIS
jgi:ABC-type Fe3+ transport system substrate-binding protein